VQQVRVDPQCGVPARAKTTPSLPTRICVGQYGDVVTFEDDLAAEGAPEVEFHAGVAAGLPRKRVAGGLLIRGGAGRVLFVEPRYKPYLEIPGGMAESNESPAAACHREVREELNLDLAVGRLLIVDWMPAHGVWGDGIMFIFDGGILGPDQTRKIKLNDEELGGATFLTVVEASTRLKPSMARRLTTALVALENGAPVYAEFGRHTISSE
jgi:ADP-ribose pyrophosphatase YjhB (NUDIX family)